METLGPFKGKSRDYIGVIIGIMENKMEATIWGLGFRVIVPLKQIYYGFGQGRAQLVASPFRV